MLVVFGLPINKEASTAIAIRHMTMNVTIPATIICHTTVFKVGLMFPCGVEFTKNGKGLCFISMHDDK